MLGAPDRRRVSLLVHIGLAIVAWVPFFASAPGDVAADTKQYLYLDPGRLLSSAAYMWDPAFGAGTVPHQNIGYLFPMGPYYWLMDQIGSPDWVAQRLWLGAITFAAGAGVLFLLRTLHRRGVGAVAAALIYMLSPYVLAYTARQSVILLPWAGLPWLIALAERSLRQPGWRQPALFALVVFTIGGTNATSLLFAGVGPALWIVFAVFIERDVHWRVAAAAVAKIGVLTLVTSLWWIIGLSVQSGFGLPIPDYTETVRTVAQSSSPLEVLRGLGNWFFYGRDGVSPWIEQSGRFQQQLWLLVATFAIPVLAFVLGALTRWRYRAYFVALILIGTVIAVGTYPYNDPSIVGRLFKQFAEGSTVGLAMRSTPRAVPLVTLGVAVLIGAGIAALLAKRRRLGLSAAVLAGILAIAALPTAWNADYVAANLRRPENLPQYWLDAAHALDQQGSATRVLELPGSDFSSYRWGTTVDPILPGLMSRPWVERELQPFGSQASADLLIALDRRIQEGVVEPAELAPAARLFAAGDIVVRYDLAYERYRTARPRVLSAALSTNLPGLDRPVDFGPHTPNRASPAQPMLDAVELAIPAGTADPAKVQVYGVKHAEAILRTATAANPVVVAGDGEGLIDAAAAGVIDGRTLVVESASYAKQLQALRKVLARDADLIVTDTNRRRVRHWGGVRDTTGYTEQAGEQPLVNDPGDKRLTPFPVAGDDTRAVTILRGVRSIQATTYGDPIVLSPEDRPSMAFDGDVRTAWREGARAKGLGEHMVVKLLHPVTTDHMTLVQPQTGLRDRFVTDVGLTFDGGSTEHVRLGPASRSAAGERITFPRRTFRTLQLSIDGAGGLVDGQGALGFAEVKIPGVHVDEVVRLPVDLLRAAGASSLQHRLTILMTRLRGDQAEYVRSDEEPALARVFDLPTGRTFALTGIARLDGRAASDTLDAVLGMPDAAHGGVTARASSHLDGDVRSRAAAALDGDPNTAWTPAFGGNVGQWIDAELPVPVTFDHLDLALVADGRHSVPTRLRVEPDGAPAFSVDVPPIADATQEHAVARSTVRFPAVTARRLRVTVEAVRPVDTIEYFSRSSLELPVAIAELGIPGVHMPATPASVPAPCRTDLLTIDGHPFGIRVTGSTRAAEARDALTIEPCGATAAGLTLTRGQHVLRAARGLGTGIDLDRLSLASGIGGGPRSTKLLGQAGGERPGPSMTVTAAGQVSSTVRVHRPRGDFWLVLAQSHNDGWHAELADGTSLGPPTLVDGMANAWLVHPRGNGDVVIRVRWTPQDRVWIGLGISALGVLLCLVLVLRRRRPSRVAVGAATGGAPIDDSVPSLRSLLASPNQSGPGRRPSRAVLTAIPVAVAVIGAVISSPWVGLAAGALSLGALLDHRLRSALRLSGGIVLAAGALYVVVQELRLGYPAAYDWPQRFLRVNNLPWLALVLLAADVAVDMALDRLEA